MTDQRHPDGGDTIDAEVGELIGQTSMLVYRDERRHIVVDFELNEFGFPVFRQTRNGTDDSDHKYRTDRVNELAYSISRRLAAADRAVTRGDSVTISREQAKNIRIMLAEYRECLTPDDDDYFTAMGLQDMLKSALATPTETTDAEGES
jgi:hypothetical protein